MRRPESLRDPDFGPGDGVKRTVAFLVMCLAVFLIGVVLRAMCQGVELGYSSSPTVGISSVGPVGETPTSTAGETPAATTQPNTNRYHIQWVWTNTGVNPVCVFLNSNGVTMRSAISTNRTVTFSNLMSAPNGAYAVEAYALGNETNVVWNFTNYARALFSTNLNGPWAELPQTTWANPPGSGFLKWQLFNNLIVNRD